MASVTISLPRAAPHTPPPPSHTGLGAWLESLSASPAAPRLLCRPCSASNEVFTVCAVTADEGPVKWFTASAASALFANQAQHEEVDVAKQLRAFARGFECLYGAPHHAVNVGDVPDVRTLTVSVGNTLTAHTCSAFLLPSGEVVCFESQSFFRPSKLVVLQRCAYASARTFDALLVPHSHAHASELRLVDKTHLQDVSTWAQESGAVVFRAPGEPVPARLLLRLFGDGMTAEAIALAFLRPPGADSDASSASGDDADEWCASSDASSGYSEDADMSDFDEHEAAAAVADLKD